MSVLTGRFYLHFLSLRKTWERQTFQNQKQFRTPVYQQYKSAWRQADSLPPLALAGWPVRVPVASLFPGSEMGMLQLLRTGTL